MPLSSKVKSPSKEFTVTLHSRSKLLCIQNCFERPRTFLLVHGYRGTALCSADHQIVPYQPEAAPLDNRRSLSRDRVIKL